MTIVDKKVTKLESKIKNRSKARKRHHYYRVENDKVLKMRKCNQ